MFMSALAEVNKNLKIETSEEFSDGEEFSEGPVFSHRLWLLSSGSLAPSLRVWHRPEPVIELAQKAGPVGPTRMNKMGT
jgi:hypothetical protein